MAATAVCAPSGATPFRNTTNTPFATRCDGPQGALIIADDGAVAPADARVEQARKLRHAAATLARLKRLGLAHPRATARAPRLAVHTQGGRLVLPDLVRSAAVGDLGDPANQLSFEYEGWTAPEQAVLENYLAAAYPKARLVYGPPAFNITVKIIRDDSIDVLQGGIYDATANEIRMPELTGNVAEDTFILMLLVLRAFHDDVGLFYDAWEQGFVGAAATAVQLQPGVSPEFDPKDPGPFYALSVYEAENHPELGNPTFFPEGDFGGMLVWRIAAARAAWTKCWIQDPDFFSNFNQLYYTRFTEGLQGDVLSLREIAAAVLPTVEGLPFQEWYPRQYVLDTSVRSGLKEYTWNIPLDSAVVLIVEHYLTDEVGNEYVRGGQARAIYWSFDFSVNLFAEEGNLIDVPTTGDTPGEGFLIPTFFNIGGPQRITVQIDLNGLSSNYPFPYGVRGFDPGENNLYGGILNETSGEIDVEGGDGIVGLDTRRGIWGDRITAADLSPLKLAVTFTNSSNEQITRHVNVGWDSYMLLVDGGAQTTVSHTFSRGTTGLHMMSLPLTPVQQSAPEALGIAAADFLLARWDAAAPPEGRYRVWPVCEPFAPGKGFWLRVLQDVNASILGVKPSDDNRILVPLELGWNMIGSPRLDPIPVEALKVQVGTDTPVPLAEAVSKRYVQNGIFGYDQSAGYSLVDELFPFEGYWLRCLLPAGCRLAFEPVQTASAQTAQGSSARLPRPDWRLPIHVQCGQLASTAAYLGGAQAATDGNDPEYDIQAPPAFGPYVAARFLRGENSGPAYVADVRGPEGLGESWLLQFTSTVPSEPVRVSWPDLCQVPTDLRPVLTDLDSGKRVYMRTSPGYTVGATDEGTCRRLRIDLSGPGASTLVVSSMAATAHRGAVTVAYTLSRDASVRARVLNIAGRPVRALAQDRVQTSGANSLVWNLSSDNGARVPNGLYLVEVQARGDDGSVARGVRSVRVSRR